MALKISSYGLMAFMIIFLCCQHRSEKINSSTLRFELVTPKKGTDLSFNKKNKKQGISSSKPMQKAVKGYVKLKIYNHSDESIFFKVYDSLLILQHSYKIINTDYPGSIKTISALTHAPKALKLNLVELKPNENALFDLIYPFYINDGTVK
ncbi:MAG: hypothetical protein AAFU64_01900, partial [Bacteroidota bacterium]